MVIVASKGGADEHPAWYLNLRDGSQAEFQIAPQEGIGIEKLILLLFLFVMVIMGVILIMLGLELRGVQTSGGFYEGTPHGGER